MLPAQELAPPQGANQLTRSRRSALRFDLRLLSHNPPGCKTLHLYLTGNMLLGPDEPRTLLPFRGSLPMASGVSEWPQVSPNYE